MIHAPFEIGSYEIVCSIRIPSGSRNDGFDIGLVRRRVLGYLPGLDGFRVVLPGLAGVGS